MRIPRFGRHDATVGAERQITFSDVTSAVGIDIGDALWGTYGAQWGDYDNDGYADLLICRHAVAPALYHNNGRGGFVDVAQQSGLHVGILEENFFLLDRHACAWGDYDGDGYLDLYCSMGARDGQGSTPNQLFRNDHNGHFTDVASDLGIQDASGRGRDVHWIDYNNDGRLDLYVSNLRREGAPSRLFRGDGRGFSDATADAKLGQAVDILGGGSSWCDYDGDGHMDLLIGGYDGLALRRNLGDGTFAADSAAAVGLTATRVRSMSWGDYDNDGLQDLFVARIGEPARLYRNSGGAFEDVTAAAGIDCRRAAAGVWGDFNNDGHLDLFVVQEYSPSDGLNLPNLLYMNNGDGTFTEVGAKAGVVGPSTGSGDSAAIADYNNDGFLDIAVTHAALQTDEPDGPQYMPLSGEGFPPGRIEQYPFAPNPISLYRNNRNGNHWVELRLDGAAPNTFACGAKVWLTAGGVRQFRELADGVVQYGQSDRIIHFGLGNTQRIDEVLIRWPNGEMQRLGDLKPDRIVHVKQPRL